MINVDLNANYGCNFQGRKKREPALKLMNVSKGIYVVNYEPTLSALQSFSIAVAFIHSHETVI